MAKCLNCNNERKGRSVYCGDTCRVVWNRNRKRNTEALIGTVTPVTEKSVTITKAESHVDASDISMVDTNFVSLPGRACYGVV